MMRNRAPGPRGIVGCVQGVEMLDLLNTRTLGWGEGLCTHSVPLREKSFTKIYPDMGPPAKLSYRSAIHKKVVFGPG